MSTLIVGCGYLGTRMGIELVRRGEQVLGTVRSRPRAAELDRLGIEPIVADVLNPETLDFPEAQHMLYCVGYDRTSRADRRTVHVQGLKNVLERLPAAVHRFVYASSTSVYGQSDGSWVTEDSPAEPLHDAGRVCLLAEAVARQHFGTRQGALVVLRFAGLYGPGRVIRRALLERGEPIPVDPACYLNLVHIDDAARAAVAALDAAHPEPLYLVSDDRPVPRSEYYTLAARLLGARPPRYEPAGAAGREQSADFANRRISNARLRLGLGVALHFPDISTGLEAAIQASRQEADG